MVSRVQLAPGVQPGDQIRLIRTAVQAHRTVVAELLVILQALHVQVGNIVLVVACEPFLPCALFLLDEAAALQDPDLIAVCVCLAPAIWCVIPVHIGNC